MSDNNNPLSGKVAVITGAGRGIGRAIALAYADAGAAVVLAARTADEIDAVAREIEASSGTAKTIACDVTKLPAVTALFVHAVAALGGIDIVVVNAGASRDRETVEASDPAAWRATIDVNLMGAYHCVHAAIPHLKKRGAGKIITIGSGIGHEGIPSRSAYACSKAGLWMLTRVLAKELWKDRISVNELIPGPVETELYRSGGGGATTRLAESEWVKRPEDVVDLAMFLATQPDVGPTGQSFSLMRR